MILKDYNLFVGSTTGSLKGVLLGKCGNEMKIASKNLIRNKENISNKNEIKCLNWSDEREDEILVGAKNEVSLFETSVEEYTCSAQFLTGEPRGIFAENRTVFVGSTSGAVLSNELTSKSDEWKEVFNTKKPLECLKRSSFKCNIVATGGKDNDLKLWDLNTCQMTFNAKNIKPDELQIAAPIFVSDIVFCRDSEKVASCMRTGYVRLYDPLLPQRRPVFHTHYADQAFTCISETPRNNQFCVGSATGDIFLVDIRGKNPFTGKFKNFCGAVKSIASPVDASFVISVSLDRHFRVHDFTTRKLLVKEYMQSRLTTMLMRRNFILNEFQEESEEPLNSEHLNLKKERADPKSLEKDAKILDDLFDTMEKVAEKRPSILKSSSKSDSTTSSKRMSENSDADVTVKEKCKRIKWKKT